MLWDSSVFPGQAADGVGASETRVTVMMGGARDPAAVDRSDDDLSEAAVRAARELYGARVDPTAVRIFRARSAIPQPVAGHHWRVARTQSALARAAPWLRLLGNSFFGVGSAASIANGELAALRVAQEITDDP